ncbi:MAG: hypothetical protein JNK61_10685 [Bacteroidia bacterium]|nr:hypothetical protein [Bacteroidia bacterium]HQV01289.1 hypothetical protein [Bacteroidia bacterium]
MKHLSILSLSVACIFFIGVGIKHGYSHCAKLPVSAIKTSKLETQKVNLKVEQTTVHFVTEIVKQTINNILH